LAKSPVKIQNFQTQVDHFTTEETSHFILEGTASHLGQFTAYGEVDFVPGEEEGSLVGEGVVVFEAADSDLLVGVVEWQAGPEADDGSRSNSIHFSWRDSVELSDGTVFKSTGRFVDDRPPGLSVISCSQQLQCTYVCVILGEVPICQAYCFWGTKCVIR
jgi:hypothetical protein